MNKKVTLENKISIVGLSNIVVSEVDDTIYLNSQLLVDDGVKGGIAFYELDGQKISSRGHELYYDADTQTLYIPFANLKKLVASEEIRSAKITSNSDVTTKSVICDYLRADEVISAVEVKTDRLFVDKKINLQIKNDAITPIGKEGDIAGDIFIDADYFYYCTKNYDGVSNIWKRSKLESW